MRVKMLPSLAPQYFRNFSVIVVKMQIEDAVGQKPNENAGRNEEKQLKYLQGALQRRWILMMFYCLFRGDETRRVRESRCDHDHTTMMIIFSTK